MAPLGGHGQRRTHPSVDRRSTQPRQSWLLLLLGHHNLDRVLVRRAPMQMTPSALRPLRRPSRSRPFNQRASMSHASSQNSWTRMSARWTIPGRAVVVGLLSLPPRRTLRPGHSESFSPRDLAVPGVFRHFVNHAAATCGPVMLRPRGGSAPALRLLGFALEARISTSWTAQSRFTPTMYN